jgi:tRNA-specific 2-thiouridylase
MSGGVDSSVAALLSGANAGVTLKLFDGESSCCSVDDVEDARAVCQRLEIPHYTLNYKDAFERLVIDRFVSAYERGETPNPCIECNRSIKFTSLFAETDALGFETLVTGHYARIRKIGDAYYLMKGLDAGKDQSYVLYMIARGLLPRIALPLGELHKAEVRAIAGEHGFINAHKRDSQDICFIPDGDFSEFIKRRTGKNYPPCKLIDIAGNILGERDTSLRYTIGQRHGLGVSYSEPLYVKSKTDTTVTLAAEHELYGTALLANNVNVLVPDKITGTVNLTAKTRYKRGESACRAEFISDGVLRVDFTAPERAITAGQAVVLYDGDTVVCGGTII